MFVQIFPGLIMIHETGKVYAEPNEHYEVVYDIVKSVKWGNCQYVGAFIATQKHVQNIM